MSHAHLYALLNSEPSASKTTVPMSCRIDLDLHCHILAIASQYETTKTFVIHTLLNSALQDLLSISPDALAIQEMAAVYEETFSEEK